MWKYLRDGWRAWGDLIHLEGLDDRLLADMGFERDRLQSRVMGQARARPERDTPEECQGKAMKSAPVQV